MNIYKIFKDISLPILLTLVILTTSITAFASQEALSVLDAETAARIDSQIQAGRHRNRLLTDGKEYEIFINKNNEVDFRRCGLNKDSNRAGCTPLSSLNGQINPNNKCQEMKSDGDKLPKNADFICNCENNYLIAVYKDEKEDVIRIVGRNKNDKEFKVIKEITGKAIIPVEKNISCECDDDFFTFAVAADSASFPKKGVSLISIDESDGSIIEYSHPFSLKATPIIDFDGRIYFVGLDQNVYEIDVYELGKSGYYDDNEFGKRLAWKNMGGFEVVEIGASRKHSFVKLRDCGRDFYKFFSESFSCELSTEYDILSFAYVDSTEILSEHDGQPDYSSADDSIALVMKGTGYLPPSIYLMRWYVDYEPSRQFAIKPVVDAGTLIYKEVELYREAIKEIDLEHKKIDISPEKYCQLTKRFNSNFGKTRVQTKLFKDLAADYKNIEFVKPYSMTIKSPKDGVQIPVNIWPAKGASAANPKPMIIYVHGGPNVHVDATNLGYYAIMQYMASQGYWVVCPETRGSTGYGDEHEKALVNNWGQNHIDDIIAVANTFKAQAGVDPHKVFLMGHSFGGYATLATSTREDIANYFDGYVSICGISEVGKAFKEGSELESRYIDYKQHYLDGWSDRIGFPAHMNHSINSKNIKISPFYHVNNLGKPVLLIHGKNDTTVLPNQSEDFFWQAKDSEKQVASVMLKGEGHHIGIYGHAVLPLKFFNEIVAGKCSSILSSNAPIYTYADGVKKPLDP